MKFRKIFPFLIVAVLLLCGAQTVSAQDSSDGPKWAYNWIPAQAAPSIIFWDDSDQVIGYGNGYEFGVANATTFAYQPRAGFTDEYAILAINQGKVVAHSFLTGKLCLTVPTVESGPVFIVAAESNAWNPVVQAYYQTLQKDNFAPEFKVANCPESLESLPAMDFSVVTTTGDQVKGTTRFTSLVSANFIYLPPTTTVMGMTTSETVGLVAQSDDSVNVISSTANNVSLGTSFKDCFKPAVTLNADVILISQTLAPTSFAKGIAQDVAKRITKAGSFSASSCTGVDGYDK